MNNRQKRIVFANYGIALMVGAVAVAMLISGFNAGEQSAISRRIWFTAGMFTLLIAAIVGIFSVHISALWRNVYWLAALASKQPGKDGNSEENADKRWPWGSHHTDLLGHLDAAAQTFWVRYDPTDPSTAPTNEMVSRWLREERGVSREKAEAIASILRADGLKPGPRR